MKKLLRSGLVLGLSFVFALQSVPLSAWAQREDASAPSSHPVQEGEPAEASPVLTAEWEETGALNADGTPVTADQGDTPEASGVDSVLSDDPPAPPAQYTLTLDLDGGQVNAMQSAGWTQSSYQTHQWTRSLPEAAAGQGVSLTADRTLGGLLPGQPYRAGYSFVGWNIGGREYSPDQAQPVTIAADTTVVTLWQIAVYTVSFQGSTGPLWTVQVPFGSTLWTEPDTPWTSEDVSWTDDTATVSISLNGATHPAVSVTRHPLPSTDAPYYYTFAIDGVLYFTYGGPTPTKEGQQFTSWKLLSGGSGCTVTGDAVFTAQFQAEQAYVIHVYFYYENGTKAGDTLAIHKSQTEVENGALTFPMEIPTISHYTATPTPKDGVTWKGDTVTVDVDAMFGPDNPSATNFLALTVLYTPAQIAYTVEYYQQSVGEGESYVMVERTPAQRAEYGGTVSIQDRSDAPAFEGFQVRADSQSAVTEGVLLREGTPNVTFDPDGTATIRVYYDRASYFIYFQTGTAQVQIEPLKVQYGGTTPSMEEYSQQFSRTGYEPVTADDIRWYRLDGSGQLVALSQGLPGTMPAHDLYAVVTWTPATTSLRLVYWVESRNAVSYQNAYTTTVDGVATEAQLTVNLDGGVTIHGVGWPDGAEYTDIVSQRFRDLMRSRYGSDAYDTFFSYSPDRTKASPGNVANAQVTGSGGVTGGTITQDSYTVMVNGDGTTTINIYYTRNLYSLEFVLARQRGNTLQVASSTPGSFASSTWTSVGTSRFVFEDFTDGVTAAAASAGETYGGLTVEKTYRLTEAINRDSRSAVGRYGTKTIGGYSCYVYTLTARFEADLTALWPTVANVSGRYGDYTYISMGTDTGSYYRNVFTQGNTQKNILNVYSTMDLNVVAAGTTSASWHATPDGGGGTVAHQLVAYWASGASEYHYYFLYEVLDTTVSVSNSSVETFYPGTADRYEYSDGQYVSWNNKVYVYSTSYDIQYSTSTRSGQNQPARQGFDSVGKRYYAGTDDEKGGNIYFFYTRETYTLDIQNVDDRYSIPASLLTTQFDCLSSYGAGIQTLRQLGWVSANADGTVSIRYGGALAPLGEEEVITWLTAASGGQLEYPYPSTGENQHYFWRWYRNLSQTIPVDWEADHEIQTMTFNNTLYAGWFTIRYPVSYVLNGGTWNDTIDYTLTMVQLPEGDAPGAPSRTVYLYYPHQAQDPAAPLYWYVQRMAEDRLYVDTLYTCAVGDVAVWDGALEHWRIDGDLTSLNDLLALSAEDTTGTRLVGHHYCYMGEHGAYNHQKYVNINAPANSVLEEPAEPTRMGYAFRGWYYFDQAPASGTKIYLKDVLTGTQSLASYGEGYVYLDHVGDAFLLHQDETGALFYYPEQTGYRFSYANDASVAVRDVQLCAAWESQGDANAVVYHLVEAKAISDQSSFTPKGGTELPADPEQAIAIGGVDYYILETEELSSLYTGTTYPQTAWEYCTDDNGMKWLPVQATIDLHADARTQTVTDDDLASVTGNTYRVEQPDGTYTYFAFFVYNPTDEIVYNVYAIDLSVAVAEGALASYQDTFPRWTQVEPTTPYFLGVEEKSVKVEDIQTTLVVENAPTVSGYTVYEDWSQTLQLQTDASANNLFFYYVRDNAQITYSITYYLMVDGGYSPHNTVTIRNIPAVTGEILSLTDLGDTYHRLVTMTQTYSTYSGSTNQAQASLYDRYKGMTVAFTQGGAETTFTVDETVDDTLDLADIDQFHLDYYVDSWSPTGSSLVVSDGAQVEVYLAAAQLIVQKVDTSQVPLGGAQFTLERLVADPNGPISYGGTTYAVDPTFEAVAATSGTDGRAIFYNLSARVWEGGTGCLYRLTETQAPRGYHRLAEPLYVTTPYTVEGNVSYTVTYTVANAGVAYLPGAGLSGGVYVTMFLGMGLVAAGVGWGVVFGRRKKSRS